MRRSMTGLAALWAMAGQAPAQAAPLPMAYYSQPGGLASLKAEASTLKILSADSYAISASGAVSGATPTAVAAIATDNHMLYLAVVSNYASGGFKSAIARAVLTQASVQTTAIANIVRVATSKGYGGINIDFESVPHALRAQYTAFTKALAASLHKQNKKLVLSVPAKTSDDPDNSWSGAYDFAALAAFTDILQVMTYDENGPWGAPGPVAGLDWVTACIAYTETVVPKAQISMGMPAYGYDWNTTKGTGTGLSYADAPALIAKVGATVGWNATYDSPYFTYTDSSGDAHTVWFENAQSITDKARYAADQGVQSVSVWELGDDDPAYWQAVAAGFGAAP